MSTHTNPRREQHGTYFVEDQSNQEELTRLHHQDHMVTAGMGGVLPEQPESTTWQRILDVGCATGGWLIETAKTHPTTSLLVGVDASSTMINYARNLAKAEQVNDRVEFHAMDALRMLEFPTEFFDLVNHRMGWSWVRTWDWPKLLQEYQRVCTPGGVIRVTEADLPEGNSPAMTRLHSLLLQATYQAGRLFTSDSNGVSSQLANLLPRYGVQHVQTRTYKLEYRPGTAQWQSFYEDFSRAYRTSLPFLRKWIRLPEDYEKLQQQALSEMQQPDFVATWNLVTAWGTKGDTFPSAEMQR
jgi:ubiquinone/menaquinone biosynthesis C-methylase UbiE